MSCSLGSPLSYRSPVVVFPDRGHSRLMNFYSTVSVVVVVVVRVKSYENSLFDSPSVPVRISILYRTPTKIVA